MKSKTIVIKRKYLLFIFILSIVFFICLIIYKSNLKSAEGNILIGYTENMINSNTDDNQAVTKEETAKTNYKKKEAYTTMPQDVDGYEVVAKLEIPKINLTTYVLSETNKNTLNTSVTKFCGPKVNGIGNFCITGHNYYNDRMFGNLKKLENNDKIYLTDIYDNKVEYVVYDIYKVKPDDLECLSQDTNGEREITLITCTKGAVKRLIIKAVELYD